MATIVFAETLHNLQHSLETKPENRSGTIYSSCGNLMTRLQIANIILGTLIQCWLFHNLLLIIIVPFGINAGQFALRYILSRRDYSDNECSVADFPELMRVG
jgi:hypothetical protein